MHLATFPPGPSEEQGVIFSSPPPILAELEAESVNKSQKKFFLATILLKSKQKTSAIASKMGQKNEGSTMY